MGESAVGGAGDAAGEGAGAEGAAGMAEGAEVAWFGVLLLCCMVEPRGLRLSPGRASTASCSGAAGQPGVAVAGTAAARSLGAHGAGEAALAPALGA